MSSDDDVIHYDSNKITDWGPFTADNPRVQEALEDGCLDHQGNKTSRGFSKLALASFRADKEGGQVTSDTGSQAELEQAKAEHLRREILSLIAKRSKFIEVETLEVDPVGRGRFTVHIEILLPQGGRIERRFDRHWKPKRLVNRVRTFLANEVAA